MITLTSKFTNLNTPFVRFQLNFISKRFTSSDKTGKIVSTIAKNTAVSQNGATTLSNQQLTKNPAYSSSIVMDSKSTPDDTFLKNSPQSAFSIPHKPVDDISSTTNKIPHGTKPGFYGFSSWFNTNKLNSEKMDAEVIQHYTDVGILKYKDAGKEGKALGAPSLTKDAYRSYNSDVKPLPRTTPVIDADKEGFIVGTLEINENTLIPTPVQNHLVVGVENPDTNSVEIFSYLTSDKGISETGKIGGPSLNTKLSETNVGGELKTQNSTMIYPPLAVPNHQFTEVESGTEFVNNAKIFPTLQDVKQFTDKVEPIPYNTTGFTAEDLNEIAYNLHLPSIYVETDN